MGPGMCRHRAKCFRKVISLDSHNNHGREVPLLSPFYKLEEMEYSNYLLEDTEEA